MDWKPSRDAGMPLHRQIVDWIGTLIEKGDWPAHTRLPSHRRLAEELGVNRSTIAEAIGELIAEGYLETRKGSGTYVREERPDGWSLRSQPNWQRHIASGMYEPNYQTLQLIHDYELKPGILRLGTGELAPELLPAAELSSVLRGLELDPRDIGYSEPQGSLALRTALSRFLAKRGELASPDSLLIVSGALQALQLVSLGLLQPGSPVFHTPPSYLSSLHLFPSAGMRLAPVTGGEGFSERLRAAATRGPSLFYTIPTLNNPSGAIMGTEERRELLSVCSELRIPLLEDDVYRDLSFAEPPPPLKALDASGQVLYVGSVSKTLSPGLRIGWIAGPEPVIRRLAEIKMQTDYGSSALSQEVVRLALETGLYEQQADRLREELKRRAAFTDQLLQAYAADIASWEAPQGGFYIWLRFHAPVVTKALFLKLLKKGVLLNPGYLYAPGDAHHLRLSYAYAGLDELELGLRLLRQALDEK